MSIHSGHPFAEAFSEPERRFRGRLAARVSLWTSGEGRDRAGLTVSSQLVAMGEPWRVVAALNPDSDLAESLQTTRRAAISLLQQDQRALSDAFAGGPAPGGPFRLTDWEQSEWGPVPMGQQTWAGVSLENAVEVGWQLLVTCTLDHLVIDDRDDPLVNHRGRLRKLGEG